MTMNARLQSYLRTLGLAADAENDAAWEFFRELRGLQATIANCLNYQEQDSQARASCDLALRAVGVDPFNPHETLDPPTDPPQQRAGTDGASADGKLEQSAEERGRIAERDRRTQIEQYAVMSGSSDELRGELIDGDFTADQARDRIWEDHQSRTRASVPTDLPGQSPAGHRRDSVSNIELATIEAAVLHGRGLDPTTSWAVNDNGTPRVRQMTPDLERAIENAYQHRAASLEDIIRMCARLDNVNLPMGRNGLLQEYIRSSSTAALSAVFTTNVNSELLQSYQVTPDSTGDGWVRESDVSDFRVNERARMENGGALKKLPRGGEAEHATYSDIVESFKIARYAAQFLIDDQDIQDDNFGGLTGFVPADMGVAARQVRPDLVYSILMGNPDMRDSVALFHAATHGNLNTSAALAVATLKAGRAAMRVQQENGRNLNVMPKFLIVPPTLEDDADTLLHSRLLITGESSTKAANNPNANKGLVVVTDARLQNGVTDPTDGTGATVHAGSTTSWFLSAVSSSHTIECAYLRGTGRAPQIRPFVLSEGRWGLGWDVKMDVGAKALDWRGMQKNTA